MKNLGLNILFIILFFSTHYLTAQNIAQPLFINKVISKTIHLKEEHTFSIKLEKGQFALLNAQQQGIDLQITTVDTEGNEIENFDSLNGDTGDEMILIDATKTGTYQISVIPLGERKKQKQGIYQIEWISTHHSITEHLEEVFKHLNDRNFLPGFAVSLVDGEQIVYSTTQGWANVADRTPYTLETCQNIASVSKTLIGISLMKLVEQGKFTLDTDINTVLPFKVTNPHFPNTTITIKDLATHTAAIDDGKAYKKAYYMADKDFYQDKEYNKPIQKELNRMAKNDAMSMSDYLKAFFTPVGRFYSKKNFFKRPAGQEWYYSNIGATLAAYIVEVVSGQSYDSFVMEHIIRPLELNSTSFGKQENANITYAKHYDKNRTELPYMKMNTYPDGGIYTNSIDLSNYLLHWMKAYEGQCELLQASSYQEIMKVQYEEKKKRFKGRKEGIFWIIGRDEKVVGHSGGDTGVSALMFFYPEAKVGYTMLINSMPSESDDALVEYQKIREVVKRYVLYWKK